mgnify:CR=1 FL=1
MPHLEPNEELWGLFQAITGHPPAVLGLPCGIPGQAEPRIHIYHWQPSWLERLRVLSDVDHLALLC